MYDVIQLTVPSAFSESCTSDDYMDNFYTEAVFTAGKEKLSKSVELFTKIKEKLLMEINEQDVNVEAKNGKMFDPEKFWKDKLFRDLEDEISKVFGFRIVDIQPYQEKWDSAKKQFESKELNAYVYRVNRYPCEGLVTDKGFYDESHSLYFEMVISLGMIKELEPKEVVSVMLHELGHAVDPALVDIKYMEANILSKYLTDRKGSLTKSEQKIVKETNRMTKWKFVGLHLLSSFKSNFLEIFMSKDKAARKNLEKIKKALADDKQQFNRQEFSEAYADNFARMYGFGAQLISALKKIGKKYDDELVSRVSKEKTRQSMITSITLDSLKDVHKTDIHRLHSLEREYKKDINDPNTPDVVKKQLQADLDELLKIYDEYTNNFSDFQSKVNKLIYEEISALDDVKEEQPKSVNESANTSIFSLNLPFMESASSKSSKMKKKVKKSDAEIASTRSNMLMEKIAKKYKAINKLYDGPENAISKEDEAKIRKAMKQLFDDTKVKSIRLIPGKMYTEDDKAKRLDTKIGGIPYWPNNMEWPTGAKGTPMICLAQLNFDKLPKLEGYPSTGILQFFIESAEDVDIKSKVIYHKTANEKDLLDTPLRYTTMPSKDKSEDDKYFPVQGVYYPTAKIDESGIRCQCDTYSIDGKFSDVADMLDRYLKKEFGDNISKAISYKARSIYFHDFNEDFAGTRIGGWPYFTQSDPRDKNHDILLFQCDSEAGIMWGDMGVGNFFISKDKLASLNFDDVMFTWDCF